MEKIKIKTKREFKEAGLWDKENKCPKKWNHKGLMNYLMGTEVEAVSFFNMVIVQGKNDEAWKLAKDDYAIVKEVSGNDYARAGQTKEIVGKISMDFTEKDCCVGVKAEVNATGKMVESAIISLAQKVCEKRKISIVEYFAEVSFNAMMNEEEGAEDGK